MRRRILVIEPDHFVGRLIKIFLENTGKYVVIYASDVMKALSSSRIRKIDLVLVNSQIYSPDGTDLFEFLRNNLKGKIPIVAIEEVVDSDRLKASDSDIRLSVSRAIIEKVEKLLK